MIQCCGNYSYERSLTVHAPSGTRISLRLWTLVALTWRWREASSRSRRIQLNTEPRCGRWAAENDNKQFSTWLIVKVSEDIVYRLRPVLFLILEHCKVGHKSTNWKDQRHRHSGVKLSSVSDTPIVEASAVFETTCLQHMFVCDLWTQYE